MKVPYLIVVGAKEQDGGTINVRNRDGEDIGETTVAKLVEQLGPWSVPGLVEALTRKRAKQSAA